MPKIDLPKGYTATYKNNKAKEIGEHVVTAIIKDKNGEVVLELTAKIIIVEPYTPDYVDGLSYHVVGGYYGDWNDYTSNNMMYEISINELSYLYPEMFNNLETYAIKSIYVYENRTFDYINQWTTTLYKDGMTKEYDGGFTFKVVEAMHDSEDEVCFSNKWIPDAHNIHAGNLTPNDLYIPEWTEVNNGNGSWAENPIVTSGSGLYTVVMVQYNRVSKKDQTGYALGVMKTSSEVINPFEGPAEERSVEDLCWNKPYESKKTLYITEGYWRNKDGINPAANTYGNGYLYDVNGNQIIIYGLCSSLSVIYYDSVIGEYVYKNDKSYTNIGLNDGAYIKVAMVYTPMYDNYQACLFEIIFNGEEPTPEEYPEPGYVYTSLQELLYNRPVEKNTQVYVVDGYFYTDTSKTEYETYGNGYLYDDFGNKITIYGLSGSDNCLSFNGLEYIYLNQKDFKYTGINDGYLVRLGLLYNPAYDRYSSFLIDILNSDLVKPEPTPTPPGINDEYTYYAVGGFYDNWADYTDSNRMSQISLFELKNDYPEVYQNLEIFDVKSIYIINDREFKNINSWTSPLYQDGNRFDYDAGYTLKVVEAYYDSIDKTYFPNRWICDPITVHTGNLTPNSLYIPEWVEFNQGFGTWNENPIVTAGDGLYSVIFVDYGRTSSSNQTGVALGVVKTSSENENEPQQEITISDLAINVPQETNTMLYITEGYWKNKDGFTSENNTNGRGYLFDENGNAIEIYAFSSNSSSVRYDWTSNTYKYTIARDFLTLGINEGARVRVAMLYNHKYRNYSIYLLEIISNDSQPLPDIPEIKPEEPTNILEGNCFEIMPFAYSIDDSVYKISNYGFNISKSITFNYSEHQSEVYICIPVSGDASYYDELAYDISSNVDGLRICIQLISEDGSIYNHSTAVENGKLDSNLPSDLKEVRLQVEWDATYYECEIYVKTIRFVKDVETNGVKKASDNLDLYDGAKIILAYDKFVMSEIKEYKDGLTFIFLSQEVEEIGYAGQSLCLEAVGEYWYLRREDGMYVSYSGSTNYLSFEEIPSENAQWEININSIDATIENVATRGRFIQYNTRSPRFTAYKNTLSNPTIYIIE